MINNLALRRSDDTLADRVANQACNLMNIELLHDVRSMRFSGLSADSQDASDLLYIFPLYNQLQHLTLPNAQDVHGGIVLRQISIHETPGHTRGQVDLAFANGMNGLYQLRTRHTFYHVSHNARAQTRQDIPVFGVHRKGDDLCLRRKRSSPFRCTRSEEHTSELQSRRDLVCRLLLE